MDGEIKITYHKILTKINYNTLNYNSYEFLKMFSLE